MKKFLLYTFAWILATSVLSACNDDNDQLTDTKITYYADIVLDGDDPLTVPLGTAYAEPGYTATLNNNDVTSGVTVTSDVDVNTPGVYSVEYSYTNAEGFTTSESRTVVVYDPDCSDADLTGTWTVVSPSTRTSPSQVAFAGYTVAIQKLAPGVFYCTDLMGGWYAQRAGYGNSYAMWGYISLNSANEVSVMYSHINGWGDSLDPTDGPVGTYDPDTDALAWSVSYYDTYLAWDIYLAR